jgi:1-phosphatidylinositol-4-phosphate 5-kinase
MNSVYHTDKYLQTFYDLKGSELGRSAKSGQDVLKDNDLRQGLPEQAMSLHPEPRARVRAQMVSDCNFLSSMKIMDYSLLIGVHHIPPKEPDHEHRSSIAKTGFRIRKERQSKNIGNKKPHAHMDGDDSSGYNSDGHSIGGSIEPPSRTGSANTETRNGAKREGNLAEHKLDSTRKLIKDIRDSNVSLTNCEFAGLLEEEDDCSYLEGSGPSNADEEAQRNIARYQAHPKYDDIELKKEQTIEQIYWPFHRFYDINGFRRMKPKACFRCNAYPCTCENHTKLVKAWKIPEFVPPLSNRKDGGLMMNTIGLEMPMTWKGPTGERQYEGKIFYMGIIDILQQFNMRKRVETNYRKIDALKGQDPSCVHPKEYAERFISFFDEYSDRCIPPKKSEWKKNVTEDENTEIEASLTRGHGKETVDHFSVSFRDVAVDVSSKQNGSPKK